MKSIVSLTVCFTWAFLAMASIATADVPPMMRYQGFLTDESGEPLNDTLSMTFTIYDDLYEGAVWWTETQPEVAVNNGLFNVLLGSVNPIEDTVFAGPERWLGITVAPAPEVVPRTRLVTVPYAFRAATVDRATGGLISGDIFQADFEGDTICEFSGFGTGGGFIGTYGPNGNLNTGLTCVEGYPNNGGLGVKDANSQWRAEMLVGSDDVGIVRTKGPNGNLNARITYLIDHPDNGFVEVSNFLGIDRGNFYVNDSRAGMVILQGPNNTHNVVMRSVEDAPYPNGGSVGVCDHDGWMRAELAVISSGQGIVQGDTKNFRVANPNEPGKDIWYCCLEGPEAAAYVRGTGHLVGGRAQVTLPDHFVAVASQQGITVEVTPLSAKSKGLAVVEKSSEMFAVREVNNGNGTYDFDFMVTAVRKGHEDYKVIRPAMKMRPPELGDTPDGSEILLKKRGR